jgi:hypothetical protein
VVGEGMTDGIVLMVSQTHSGNTFDSVKTVGTSTSYSLTLNSGNTNPALINVDNLKFDYATQTFCF